MDFIIATPEYIRDALKSEKANFSLYYPRMCKQYPTGGKKDDYLSDIVDNRKKFSSLLQEIPFGKRQKAYIGYMRESGLPVVEIEATLTSPLITGLGMESPTETGIVLDRNLGVPYIPASSVKGVLRLAHAINLAKKLPQSEVEKVLKEGFDSNELSYYFGSTDTDAKNSKRGRLVFLDVYPKNIPELKLDIMTTHYPKYYMGDKNNSKPLENEEPVPVPFLAVKEGTVFVFRCVYLPLFETDVNGKLVLEKYDKEEAEKIIKDMFQTAFNVVGFGAKTSIGYGRFKVVVGNVENKVIKSVPTEVEGIVKKTGTRYGDEVSFKQNGKELEGYIQTNKKNKIKIGDRIKVKVGNKRSGGMFSLEFVSKV